MKKILLGAMIASVALAASAAEVTSDNVVGYQKIDLAKDYNMVGISFQQVTGENSISVQNIKANGLKGYDWVNWEPGDVLMIWDAAQQGYLTTLYYAGDVQTEEMTLEGAEAGTWFDMDINYETANLTLENGDAFWIVSSSETAKVTISGEVPSTANSINIESGYNMIANPYPKAVKINDLASVSGLKGYDWVNWEPGDTVMIWDAAKQGYLTTLYYAGDVQTEEMTLEGAEAGTWFDMDINYETATTEIPAGGAFWIKSSGTGTLTFK